MTPVEKAKSFGKDTPLGRLTRARLRVVGSKAPLYHQRDQSAHGRSADVVAAKPALCVGYLT
jgi:hypothetical protein